MKIATDAFFLTVAFCENWPTLEFRREISINFPFYLINFPFYFFFYGFKRHDKAKVAKLGNIYSSVKKKNVAKLTVVNDDASSS